MSRPLSSRAKILSQAALDKLSLVLADLVIVYDDGDNRELVPVIFDLSAAITTLQKLIKEQDQPLVVLGQGDYERHITGKDL